MLPELRPGEFRDVVVLGGRDLRKHFDQGDLRSEPAVEGCELDADGARPDDQ